MAEVYVDNDVSAYSGPPRPAWQRLIADVKAGTVDALAAWQVDRFTALPSLSRSSSLVTATASSWRPILATLTSPPRPAAWWPGILGWPPPVRPFPAGLGYLVSYGDSARPGNH